MKTRGKAAYQRGTSNGVFQADVTPSKRNLPSWDIPAKSAVSLFWIFQLRCVLARRLLACLLVPEIIATCFCKSDPGLHTAYMPLSGQLCRFTQRLQA